MSTTARIATLLAVTITALICVPSALAGAIFQTGAPVKVVKSGGEGITCVYTDWGNCGSVLASGGFTLPRAGYVTLTGQVTIDQWSPSPIAETLACVVWTRAATGESVLAYTQITRPRGTYTLRWSQRHYLAKGGHLVSLRCRSTATYALLFARDGAASWT